MEKKLSYATIVLLLIFLFSLPVMGLTIRKRYMEGFQNVTLSLSLSIPLPQIILNFLLTMMVSNIDPERRYFVFFKS